MFIRKEKVKNWKAVLQNAKQELDESKTAQQLLYEDNCHLQQDRAELKSANVNACDEIQNVIRQIDQYDYKTMNVYSFLRGIKEELSTVLERIR